MIPIPKDITIPLDDLQRAAFKSLIAEVKDANLGELLQVVLARGLRATLVGQDLPEVRRQLGQGSQPDIREHDNIFGSPRVSSNYIGFPLDSEQEAQFDELHLRHAHLSEEELCRIIFDSVSVPCKRSRSPRSSWQTPSQSFVLMMEARHQARDPQRSPSLVAGL